MNTLDQLFGAQSHDEQVEQRSFVLTSQFLSIAELCMDEQGMTRRELAERIGTSASYVTQLFRGQKTPNIEMIAKLELALGIEFQVSDRGARKRVPGQPIQAKPSFSSMKGGNSMFFATNLQGAGDHLLNQSA